MMQRGGGDRVRRAFEDWCFQSAQVKRQDPDLAGEADQDYDKVIEQAKEVVEVEAIRNRLYSILPDLACWMLGDTVFESGRDASVDPRKQLMPEVVELFDLATKLERELEQGYTIYDQDSDSVPSEAGDIKTEIVKLTQKVDGLNTLVAKARDKEKRIKDAVNVEFSKVKIELGKDNPLVDTRQMAECLFGSPFLTGQQRITLRRKILECSRKLAAIRYAPALKGRDDASLGKKAPCALLGKLCDLDKVEEVIGPAAEGTSPAKKSSFDCSAKVIVACFSGRHRDSKDVTFSDIDTRCDLLQHVRGDDRKVRTLHPYDAVRWAGSSYEPVQCLKDLLAVQRSMLLAERAYDDFYASPRDLNESLEKLTPSKIQDQWFFTRCNTLHDEAERLLRGLEESVQKSAVRNAGSQDTIWSLYEPGLQKSKDRVSQLLGSPDGAAFVPENVSSGLKLFGDEGRNVWGKQEITLSRNWKSDVVGNATVGLVPKDVDHRQGPVSDFFDVAESKSGDTVLRNLKDLARIDDSEMTRLELVRANAPKSRELKLWSYVNFRGHVGVADNPAEVHFERPRGYEQNYDSELAELRDEGRVKIDPGKWLINVLFVVDCSGSMMLAFDEKNDLNFGELYPRGVKDWTVNKVRETQPKPSERRFDQVQEVLRDSIRELHKRSNGDCEVRVGLASFGTISSSDKKESYEALQEATEAQNKLPPGEATIRLPFRPLDTTHKDELVKKVEGLVPHGATYLFEGLQRSIEQLPKPELPEGDLNVKTVIVVVGDGASALHDSNVESETKRKEDAAKKWLGSQAFKEHAKQNGFLEIQYLCVSQDDKTGPKIESDLAVLPSDDRFVKRSFKVCKDKKKLQECILDACRVPVVRVRNSGQQPVDFSGKARAGVYDVSLESCSPSLFNEITPYWVGQFKLYRGQSSDYLLQRNWLERKPLTVREGFAEVSVSEVKENYSVSVARDNRKPGGDSKSGRYEFEIQCDHNDHSPSEHDFTSCLSWEGRFLWSRRAADQTIDGRQYFLPLWQKVTLKKGKAFPTWIVSGELPEDAELSVADVHLECIFGMEHSDGSEDDLQMIETGEEAVDCKYLPDFEIAAVEDKREAANGDRTIKVSVISKQDIPEGEAAELIQRLSSLDLTLMKSHESPDPPEVLSWKKTFAEGKRPKMEVSFTCAKSAGRGPVSVAISDLEKKSDDGDQLRAEVTQPFSEDQSPPDSN